MLASVLELSRLVEEYPDVLKALMGGAGLDFTSPEGYLNAELFSFMAPLVLIVFAIGFGAVAIAGEEDRGTIDLALANPLPRWRLVLDKAGALLALVSLLGLVLWLSLLVFGAVADLEIGAGRLIEAAVRVALLGLHFGAFALLVGCATGRRGLAIGLAAGAAVLAYLVNALALLVDWLEPYRKFSPFYHYVGDEPLRHGLAADSVAVLAGATVGMVALAMLAFSRRDLRI